MDEIQFPDYMLSKISKEFLSSLKFWMNEIFSEELFNLKFNLKKEPTYWNFYQWFDNSNGFNKALKAACEEHDLMDLYIFRETQNLPDNEILGEDITEMMHQNNVIIEGNMADCMPCPFKPTRTHNQKYWADLSRMVLN